MGDEIRDFNARIAGGKGDATVIVMWEGDAGYPTRDASVPGPRHRLVMSAEGFRFDDSGVD